MFYGGGGDAGSGERGLRERPLSASGCRRDRSADCTTPTSRCLQAETLQHHPKRIERGLGLRRDQATEVRGDGRSGTPGGKAKAKTRAAPSGGFECNKAGPEGEVGETQRHARGPGGAHARQTAPDGGAAVRGAGAAS